MRRGRLSSPRKVSGPRKKKAPRVKRAGVSYPRCAGEMTEAEFKSRIVGCLRDLSLGWAPRKAALNESTLTARTFRCAECAKECPKTFEREPGSTKRKTNRFADHIEPIVNPGTGKSDFNTIIDRMFAEREAWQALCKACHDLKTSEERKIRDAARRKAKAAKEEALF